MPSDPQTTNKSIGPSGVWGYGPQLEGSSKRHHQSSKIARDKFVSLPPYTNQHPKSQDKIGKENPFSHLRPHSEPSQNTEDEILVQKKHAADLRTRPGRISENKDAELIKYMSNVPGYLQCSGSPRENHHNNGLNFGVLEWERVEKRMPMQKSMLSRNSVNVSSEIPAHQSMHDFSVGSSLHPSQEESLPNKVKLHIAKAIDSPAYTPPLQSPSKRQHRLCQTISKSFDNISPARMIADKKIENLHQRMASEIASSSSHSRNSDVAPSSGKRVTSWDEQTWKRIHDLQDLDLDFLSPYSPDKHQNIVLLLPQDLPRNGSFEWLLSEPRMSFDEEQMHAARKSFSDAFHPGMGYDAELLSEYSYSCPLPLGSETNAQVDRFPSDKANAEREGKYASARTSNTEPSSPTVLEASKKLDQEFSNLAAANRSLSPKHLSDIVLGGKSRSWSLMDGSAVPQLIPYVPAKSGLVTSEGSASLDDPKQEKGYAHTRSRSSPLRKLLDPIRKHKPPSLHSPDVRLVKGNLISLSSDTVEACLSVSKEKIMKSNVHAFLQFTVRNGLPLFKFVVDGNDSNILAATVKKSTESGQDDFSWIYTFYAVHEMKKKGGGWTSQGNKGKGSEYTYNVVGHMKTSNLVEQAQESESVLYGVEQGHANHNTAAVCMPHRELASIVSYTKSASFKGEESDKHGDLTGNGLAECNPDGSHTYNTTVILPDGIHGLPKEGAPSPLIDRWKSGGLCDCGGWDIGCKLRVLTNQSPCYDVSKACAMSNRVDLFVQGARDKRPIFSLVPLKSGIYSVKFNTSLSLLQAFSICVAIMNSERSSELLETSHPSEAQQIQEPNAAGHCTSGKGPASDARRVPVKFFPYPAFSPVGRA